MTDKDEVKKPDNQGQADIVSNLLLWAQNHQTAAEQAQRLSQTEDWVDALFDVHGHQIFNLGLFNGKCSTWFRVFCCVGSPYDLVLTVCFIDPTSSRIPKKQPIHILETLSWSPLRWIMERLRQDTHPRWA
jgi:hypothetical protein